jgi:hypothetical protein
MVEKDLRNAEEDGCCYFESSRFVRHILNSAQPGQRESAALRAFVDKRYGKPIAGGLAASPSPAAQLVAKEGEQPTKGEGA